MFPISIGKAKNLRYDLPEFLCVALDSTSVRCRLSYGVEEFANCALLFIVGSGCGRFGFLESRQGRLPSDSDQRKVDVPGACRRRCPIRCPKRKSLSPSFMCNLHRPILRYEGSPVTRVGLSKNCPLPISNIGFRKVSKHLQILDTFCALPCPFLIRHDL